MRTEEEVLKDFEALLGYTIVIDEEYQIIELLRGDIILRIYKVHYDKYYQSDFISCGITITEHKLINELFQIWGAI